MFLKINFCLFEIKVRGGNSTSTVLENATAHERVVTSHLFCTPGLAASSQRWVSNRPQPSIEMLAERKPEFKTRLASVLWDAVAECVQHLDAEGVNEKARQ